MERFRGAQSDAEWQWQRGIGREVDEWGRSRRAEVEAEADGQRQTGLSSGPEWLRQ